MAHAVMLRGRGGRARWRQRCAFPRGAPSACCAPRNAIPATLAMAWMRELQRVDAGLKAGEVDDVAALQHWGLSAAQALLDRRERRTA